MIRIEKYSPARLSEWNAFVKETRNYLFLFERSYMDYHADRFTDHSLIFYKDQEIIAVLPANEEKNKFISHAGLTFGGLLTKSSMSSPLVLELFDTLLEYLRSKKITSFIYKAIPHIYHQVPAEDDLYALFRNQATLVRRDLTSVIKKSSGDLYQTRRKRSIEKARQLGIRMICEKDEKGWNSFWELLSNNLKERHNTSPVHTISEILLLKEKHPENIHLYLANNDLTSELHAGVVIYEHPTVAHAQYIASNESGRKSGSLDLLFDYLSREIFRDKDFFDFGISNEQNGRVLNTGLIEYKEGFGGRPIAHDTYELILG